MTPKVSIVIPAYNCEAYISNCIKSIINQTYSNIELVIVNDGSSDKTENIICEYKKIDERIKYNFQENKGPSEARNRGILHATGKYLIFIDSDDTVHEQYVELLVKKIICSGADLVCCGYRDISEYGTTDIIDFPFEESNTTPYVMELICKGTGGVLWGKIFKKEIIDKHQLKMDKNIFMCEDLIFVLQYVVYCQSFSTIKKYLYNYNRLNQGSISSNVSLSYLQNHITVCKKVKETLESINIEKQKVDYIISQRVQSIVLHLIEQQVLKKKNIGRAQVIQNLNSILYTPYIESYKDNFATNNYFYKPFIYLIKMKFISLILLYSTNLNRLKTMKKLLLLRKE